MLSGPKRLRRDGPIDVEALKTEPKTYVGSETCKLCHLEHYDSWKMTLHSRMLQDAQKNRDAIVPKLMKRRSAKTWPNWHKLKVPADKIYIPKVEEIKYTIGSQWKQRYLVEKEGKLYIAPIQYNVDTDRWVNYHEDSGTKNPGSWVRRLPRHRGGSREKQFHRAGGRLRSLPRQGFLARGAAQDGGLRKAPDHRQSRQAHHGRGGADLRLLP